MCRFPSNLDRSLMTRLAVVGVLVSLTAVPSRGVGAGVVRFDSDPAVSTAAPAEGDNSTTCTEFDDQAHGANNTLAPFSDFNASGPAGPNGLVAAEQFQFDSFGTVPQIEWVGYYRGWNSGGFFECTGDFPPDNFTIRILGDNNGLPDNDNVLFESTQALSPGLFQAEELGLVIGSRILMRYTFTFETAFEINTLEPMWLLIVNDTTPSDCFWFWRTAPPGDGVSYQDDETGWDPEDISDFDLAYCFLFLPGGETVFPPSVAFEVDGPVDLDTGCCRFGFTVRNRNAPGQNLDLSEFFVTVNKGTGASECEDIASLTPPVGWQVEFCEPWSAGQAVFRFFGGNLQPQETAFGRMLTKVNGDSAVTVLIRNFETGLLEEQGIQPFGIRGWASQEDSSALCGTGTFGPGEGQTGDWHTGNDGICALQPIPSLAPTGKAILVLLIVAGGAMLVRRSYPQTAAA